MNDSIHGGLRVCQSTPLVQLQDRGRFGCRHLGVTQGGALDWLSMGWANWLLGNPLDAAVIEIALGGFVAECRADGWLALAGGDLGATLDGQPLPAWGAFAVRGGQRWPSPTRARAPAPTWRRPAASPASASWAAWPRWPAKAWAAPRRRQGPGRRRQPRLAGRWRATARCPCPANGSWTAPAKRAWS